GAVDRVCPTAATNFRASVLVAPLATPLRGICEHQPTAARSTWQGLRAAGGAAIVAVLHRSRKSVRCPCVAGYIRLRAALRCLAIGGMPHESAAAAPHRYYCSASQADPGR